MIPSAGVQELLVLLTLSSALGAAWRFGTLVMEMIWDEVVVRLSHRWARWRRRLR